MVMVGVLICLYLLRRRYCHLSWVVWGHLFCLVEVNPRTLRSIAIRVLNRIRALDSTGLGGGSDPLAAAVDKEVADPDRGLDVVVALVATVGGDLVTMIA